VNVIFYVVAASLAGLFLWAVLAPRGLWKIAISWSYRDSYRNEPSAAVFGLYRLVAIIGIIAVVATALALRQDEPDADASPQRPLTPAEQMWGSPAPLVLNRVATPLLKPPATLVEAPILGFQTVDGVTRRPGYLFQLKHLSRAAATEANGLLGVTPPPGLVALDTADLVVHVAGDPRCFPQQVVVEERSGIVSVGVFYGQPNPPDGSNLAHLGDCDPTPTARDAVSLLIPLKLDDALGSRTVHTLDGKTVQRVDLLGE
jgi:hypothetical protein